MELFLHIATSYMLARDLNTPLSTTIASISEKPSKDLILILTPIMDVYSVNLFLN